MAVGSLGAVGYDIVAKDKTAEGLDNAGDRARKIGKIAGAAMTGVGVGMIALTDSAKKTNATIRQTALQLGVTTGEMRELTLATTNVTFPIEEVTASFDLLTRAGMENKDEIAEAATAFDTLGDAIGMSASQVTEIMVPAFNAFSISLADAGDYTDIFTHLTRNTTVELADFSSMVNYLAADLDTMDLSMQQSVAVMEALADKGIQGSAATREFRTAVSQADGDTFLFYEALGLTEAQVAKYSAEIDNAEGITQEFADAANTQYGTMDNLKHSISELTLKYGSMLEPLDALGPAMATLGPIMIMFSTIQWGTVIPSLTAATGAVWAFTAALLANPLTWIAIAIVGVVAVLIILEKKFGVVTKATEILSEGIHKLIGWLKDKLVAAHEIVMGVLDIFGDKLLFLLGPIGAIIYAFKNWEEILGIVTGVFNSVIGYITGLYAKFKKMGVDLIKNLISGVKSEIRKLKSIISDAMSGMRNMLPFSPAKEGPLSKPVDWEGYLVEPLRKIELRPDIALKGATMGEGTAKNEYHITITGNYIRDDYDVDRIADEMMSKLSALR